MKRVLKAITISTLALLAWDTQAHALTSTIEVETMVQEAALILPTTTRAKTPKLNAKATIGIARIDKGRLITTPYGEVDDWVFLNKRTEMNFAFISPAALLKNVPEVAFDGHGSVNQIDEIRMTASDLQMDYVLIYGLGEDAQWGSFGGKCMMNTGLIVNEDTSAPRGSAKALLVNTYTGEIYGTVTSEQIKYGLGDLTDRVQDLVSDLTNTESVLEV